MLLGLSALRRADLALSGRSGAWNARRVGIGMKPRATCSVGVTARIIDGGWFGNSGIAIKAAIGRKSQALGEIGSCFDFLSPRVSACWVVGRVIGGFLLRDVGLVALFLLCARVS